jgi:hypothetical protein
VNGHSHRASGPADDDSLDAAARRLREEMETALRHLREQVWAWPALGGPDWRPADGGDTTSPHE